MKKNESSIDQLKSTGIYLDRKTLAILAGGISAIGILIFIAGWLLGVSVQTAKQAGTEATQIEATVQSAEEPAESLNMDSQEEASTEKSPPSATAELTPTTNEKPEKTNPTTVAEVKEEAPQPATSGIATEPKVETSAHAQPTTQKENVASVADEMKESKNQKAESTQTPSSEPAIAATLPEPPAEEHPAPSVTVPVKSAKVESKANNSDALKKIPPKSPKLESAFFVETPENTWALLRNAKVVSAAQWRTIAIKQGNKLHYTVSPDSATAWNLVKEGSQWKIRLSESASKAKASEAFALQLLSLELSQLSKGLQVLKTLGHDGYYAYLVKNNDGAKKTPAYRLRVGFFRSKEEAQAKGQEIYFRYRDQNLFPESYWATRVPQSEVGTLLVDTQLQRQKPWIWQFPEYSTREQALQDLQGLMDTNHFFALAQKQEAQTKQIVYRVQMGNFGSEAEAQAQLNEWKNKIEVLNKAKVMKSR